ncbi:MAG: hypothetical protein IPF73_03995 [Betaproteobacteria bacterium]|nr:hypothetical protein [Betaproteobacteria bacterium]
MALAAAALARPPSRAAARARRGLRHRRRVALRAGRSRRSRARRAAADTARGPRAFFYRFATREGRIGLTGHRGWWRSFLFSLEIARAYGFERIVHVESDAFLLSRRIVDRINATTDGWTAFWCPQYGVPEPALQVIAHDQFDAMAAVAARGLDALTEALAELTIPFTRVEQGYAGNRYGETRGRIPGYADYACQVNAPAIAVRYRG